MTKQKNLGRVLLLVLALCIALSALVGCGETSKTGFATVVVGTETPTEYKVNLDKVEGEEGLLSVLAYLKETEGLTYEESGGFLSAVGDLEQDTGKGEYIYLYTSVAEDADVSVYATTQTYKDMTLTSAGVGAKDMHITDGAVIYIGLIVWGS